MFHLVTLTHLTTPDKLPHPCTITSNGEVSTQAEERLLCAFMTRAMCLSKQSLGKVQRGWHKDLAMVEQQTINPGPTILRSISLGPLICQRVVVRHGVS